MLSGQRRGGCEGDSAFRRMRGLLILCCPLSALVLAHPCPFVHLAPVLSDFLPLLVFDPSPLPGPAWLHHGCGTLHLPGKFSPGLRVGNRGCQARGRRGWGRHTHTCVATFHTQCDGSHESSMLGSWCGERNTHLCVSSGNRQCCPPLLLQSI